MGITQGLGFESGLIDSSGDSESNVAWADVGGPEAAHTDIEHRQVVRRLAAEGSGN